MLQVDRFQAWVNNALKYSTSDIARKELDLCARQYIATFDQLKSIPKQNFPDNEEAEQAAACLYLKSVQNMIGLNGIIQQAYLHVLVIAANSQKNNQKFRENTLRLVDHLGYQIVQKNGLLIGPVQIYDPYKKKYWRTSTAREFMQLGAGSINGIDAQGVINKIVVQCQKQRSYTQYAHYAANYFQRVIIDKDDFVSGIFAGLYYQLGQSKNIASTRGYGAKRITKNNKPKRARAIEYDDYGSACGGQTDNRQYSSGCGQSYSDECEQSSEPENYQSGCGYYEGYSSGC